MGGRTSERAKNIPIRLVQHPAGLAWLLDPRQRAGWLVRWRDPCCASLLFPAPVRGPRHDYGSRNNLGNCCANSLVDGRFGNSRVSYNFYYAARTCTHAPLLGQWERANNLDVELRIAQKQRDTDDTKWTIRELFQHIDSDFLEDERYEKIADELRDALSTGRLRMWGRLKETDSGSWVGPRAALKPIEESYWYTAYFTYFFFDERTSDDVHCYADRKTGRPAYTDLQVSRSATLAVWPGEPGDIADSYPNVRVADSPAVIDLFHGRERSKLIALLAAEKLSTWARRATSVANDLVKRDGEIWNDHSFQFHPKGNGEGTINQTFLRPNHPLEHVSYYDVCFNYAQLRRVWPTLPMSRTKCDIR
jgi:hypothetical protein